MSNAVFARLSLFLRLPDMTLPRCLLLKFTYDAILFAVVVLFASADYSRVEVVINSLVIGTVIFAFIIIYRFYALRQLFALVVVPYENHLAKHFNRSSPSRVSHLPSTTSQLTHMVCAAP